MPYTRSAPIFGAAFTRPANTTAYTSGQLVANNPTAGSVVPVQFNVETRQNGTGQIVRARLQKTGTGVSGAAFRIHMFRISPTPANGDGGVYSTDMARKIGYFDITTMEAHTDGATGRGIPDLGPVMVFQTEPNNAYLYALLEARGAYTPVSGEVFTLGIETIQDGP